MIIKGICIAPIFNVRWEPREFYSNIDNSHVHSHPEVIIMVMIKGIRVVPIFSMRWEPREFYSNTDNSHVHTLPTHAHTHICMHAHEQTQTHAGSRTLIHSPTHSCVVVWGVKHGCRKRQLRNSY